MADENSKTVMPKQRQRGPMGGRGFGGGRSDPNAPRRGDDVQARVTISFEEAAKGCKRKIEIHRIETCPDCGGSGAQKGLSLIHI